MTLKNVYNPFMLAVVKLSFELCTCLIQTIVAVLSLAIPMLSNELHKKFHKIFAPAQLFKAN
jgi:hypothetical protein